MSSNMTSNFIFQDRHSTYMYKVTHIYLLNRHTQHRFSNQRKHVTHCDPKRSASKRKKYYVWLERNKEKR